ncbi:MAG: ferrous iron transport protein A [Candidatus Omnitrophica bacterium]|nr:ferrous iron transport protein A [Candidatus Omnitrophota bacterium]
MKKVSLLQLKANHKGKIVELAAGHRLQEKFMSMGIFTGREIKKLSHFGLRGPVVIKVGRTIWALGHGMAAKIFIEGE